MCTEALPLILGQDRNPEVAPCGSNSPQPLQHLLASTTPALPNNPFTNYELHIAELGYIPEQRN